MEVKKYIYNCKYCKFTLSREDLVCPNCNRETGFAQKPPPEPEVINIEGYDYPEDDFEQEEREYQEDLKKIGR